MRLLSLLAATALVGLTAGAAHASIVNIDGTNSTGTTVNLAAGTYSVTYAGIAGGGLYDGYSLAQSNFGTPQATPVNYTDELSITLGAATNFGTAATYDYLVGGVQQTYATAAQALAAYQAALANGQLSMSSSYTPQNYTSTVSKITFTLATAGAVTFTAPDTYLFNGSGPSYSDNTGGVSISVAQVPTAVPEPASLALLAGGLIGLGMVARRRARG